MKRNTILYILIALLVVVGGAWYALSQRSADEERRGDRTEENQEGDTEENGELEGENGEADSEGGVSESDNQSGSTPETSTGNSNADSQGSTSQGSNQGTAGEGSTVGKPAPNYGVGGTEITVQNKELMKSELQAQITILESIVTVISLQLESGDLSPEDATDLLSQVDEALEKLEVSVKLYLAL